MVRFIAREKRKMFKKSRKVGPIQLRSSRVVPYSKSIRIPGIRRPDFGFPDRMITKLRYVDNLELSANAGVVAANVFRMNSCFDPDLSGVGHQPMYYDQLCGAVGTAPYSRYRVLQSKITCTYSMESPPSLTAANVGPVIVGLHTSNTSGLFASSVSALMEGSGSKWTYLQDKSGSNNVKTLTATYIPTRDLGLDAGDDTLAAGSTASPTQAFHAIPWKVDPVGAGIVNVIVQIEFRVQFFGRNEVSQS